MSLDRIRLREIMTPISATLTAGQSVADAVQRLRDFDVHHLPVVGSEGIVGVVGRRELERWSKVASIDFGSLLIDDVMATDFRIEPEDSDAADVLATLAAPNRAPFAIVTRKSTPVGIITTGSAFAVLWEHLAEDERSLAGAVFWAETMPAEQVREVIAAEHGILRALLNDIDEVACAILGGDEDRGRELLASGTQLYAALTKHVELENQVLAPALSQLVEGGDRRKQLLLDHHHEQVEEFNAGLARLQKGEQALVETARDLRRLVADVRIDMAHEDRDLLTPELFGKEPIRVEIPT